MRTVAIGEGERDSAANVRGDARGACRDDRGGETGPAARRDRRCAPPGLRHGGIRLTARMSACGYSLGATYRPTWMDVPPMLYSGNATPAAPGMVLFLHAILIDASQNLAMSLGHTTRV